MRRARGAPLNALAPHERAGAGGVFFSADGAENAEGSRSTAQCTRPA